MKTIANYSFLPWLRQGVANTIKSADGDASVKTRASIHVELTLAGDPVGGGAENIQKIGHDVALYGPGDLVGVDARAVIRTEPHPWVTNFESNYLPAIDFYDEDFPWRYTPAAPDGSGLRLRPWIALVVLAAGDSTHPAEFKEGENSAGKPLPYITVADAALFPPANDLWAWAHVHFNQSLGANPNELISPDMSAVLPRVQSLLGANPDLAYSRIVCPRRLADNTGYHAFLVPVFETGRLAGLALDPGGAPNATFSAWGSYGSKPAATDYPVYYRWFFRTGSRGDFEYLVRLLKPQPVDKRVGTRDMDVQDPGSGLPGISDADLGGVLRLGGALRVPDADLNPKDLAERSKYENWDQPYPHKFEVALAKFVNLPDDYAAKAPDAANAEAGQGTGTADDADPLITAPLYGRWPALTQRLLFNRDGTPAPNTTNWIHKLNLDPRFRVAANFGTDVVENNAEEYMNDAWEQVGQVLAANARIRRLLLAKEVSWRWHEAGLKPLAAANFERAFSMTAPVARRVMGSPATVAYLQTTSLVPPVYTSTVMRRVVRPRSRLMRSLPFTASISPGNLLTRVNNGEVSAAPPKVVPPGVPTVDQAGAATEPQGAPPWILDLLRKYPWQPLAVLIGALILALLLALLIPGLGLILGVIVAIAGFYVYRLLLRWQTAGMAAGSITEAGQTPAAVDQYPTSSNFVLSDPGSTFRPTVGGADSPTAVNFKNALRESFALNAATNAVSARPASLSLDLAALTTTMVRAVDPQFTIPRRGLTLVYIPQWIRELLGDQFGEVMAYPKIDLAMYTPLKVKPELFLPNVNLIAPDSITLIETNQKFIEAYMMGLNHEFARKLLWREYPTDQRGSYFRQFWDPRSYFDADNLTPERRKEKLYDIPELHRWGLDTPLGAHNHRARPGPVAEQAVLVIRGELLKKYPTAVIYAHRARWERNPDNSIDLTKPRELQDIDDAFIEHPPTTIVRTPIYEAKVDPDIYFFGFDLTIAEAKGGPGTTPNDDPGWFFVIKQRPGEPRFGLELTRTGQPRIFDELIWSDAIAEPATGKFLPAGSLAGVVLAAPAATDPEAEQHKDDVQVNGAAVSAARWAYLLFRAPVLVAVHADEMLGSGS